MTRAVILSPPSTFHDSRAFLHICAQIKNALWVRQIRPSFRLPTFLCFTTLNHFELILEEWFLMTPAPMFSFNSKQPLLAFL